jgi:hypothetical protein
VIEEKGMWLRIEPPAQANGFVAAHLLTKDAAAVAAATGAAPSVAAVPPVTTPPPVTAPPPTVEVVQPTEPAPVVATTVVTNVIPVVATNEPAALTNVAVVAPPATNVPAPVITNIPSIAALPTVSPTALEYTADTNPPPVAPPELVKRVITREGLLKGTFSIQAPSHYELRSLDNNRVINYVWSPSTNIVLKSFKGLKVLVTGEELLDERWPHTPVITVEEIAPAPQ